METLDLINQSLSSQPSVASAHLLDRKTELTSRIAWICAALCAPYYFVFDYFNLPIAKYFVIPTVAIYIATLGLKKINAISSAKLLIIIGTSISLFFYASILGKGAGAQLLLFAMVTLPILLFEVNHKLEIAIGVATPIICSFTLEFTHYSLFKIQEILPATIQDKIYNIALLTTFLLLILSALSYFISNRRYETQLEEKNKTLDANVQILKQAIQDLKAKQAMDKEIATARKIQLSIVPNTPPLFPNYEIEQCFLPARQVGGDYYDYFPFSATRIGIVIADIVGKGIPASLMMIALKNLLQSTITKEDSPSEALKKLTQIIFHHRIIEKYVPIFYGILDTRTNTFIYSNGGHEPGIYFHNDSNSELSVGGMPVGMYENQEFEEETITLNEDDKLVLFTDGLTDIKTPPPEEEYLGITAVKELLSEASASNEGYMNHIIKKLDLFRKEEAQTDDITILSIKRLKNSHDFSQLSPPNQP